MAVAIAIFALTYAAVAAGRFPGLSVDRPAAALLGAALMVAAGVLAPGEAGRAINGDTLGLLLGMMILAAYLGEAGFFRRAAHEVVRRARGPRSLLWGLTLTAGLLSAFLVNDTVCLLMTPLVARIVEEADLPPLPYLLAVAFGANVGSAATVTGNPQNMIVGTLSGLGWGSFARALALPAAVALLAVAPLLALLFRRELPRGPLRHPAGPPPPIERRLLVPALLGVGLATAGFLAGAPLAWTALLAAALCMAFAGRAPRKALARVDWPLLLFFSGLFVVVDGIGRAGAAGWMYREIAPLLGRSPPHQAVAFGLFSVGAAQVVSNVPFVLLAGQWIPHLSEPRLLWLSTALASTLGGNLTVVGSVANIIVLELAGPKGRVGFFRFLRYGATVTGVTFALAMGILLAERAVGWV